MDRPSYELRREQVDQLKRRLVAQLETDGFSAIQYGGGAVAYSRTDVPDRQEPVLIDDGGLNNRNGPILHIAIRDAQGCNKALHERVRGLLCAYVPDLQAYDGQPGTLVYEVRRSAR